jgi:ribonuclease E
VVDDKPRVVTRTRRRSASRPAGPPALPTTSTTGGAGTPPQSGLVEPGTAGVELGEPASADAPSAEAPTVEHVPIKKKGSRKR